MIFTIDSAHAGERLDVFLAREGDVTRSRAGALIREGAARVNGSVPSKAGYALREGDEVSFEVPEPAPAHVAAEDIPLEIVYQDDDLAVVYKPSGMVVHPAAGNPDGTMVNALLRHLDGLSGIGGEIRPGIVHRIDKDTSGLLLVAKNDRAHVKLAEQIAAHSIERAYRAIVIGHMKADEGDVDGIRPTARKWPSCPAGARRARTGACWSRFGARPCWNACSRPGARIRFAYIWRPSGIPCWATRCTARRNHPTPWRVGSFCTRSGWASFTPRPASS